MYRNLWPGIDLVYSGTVNKLKYEFIVQPGVDASRIKLAYSGASEVVLGEGGQLEVKTPLGSLRDDEPVAFQEKGGERVDIPMSFVLEEPGQEETSQDGRDQVPEQKSHAFGFNVGDYDRSQPLIMDPAIMVYCGYIGGSGDDAGHGIAVDGSGNAYVTGYTVPHSDISGDRWAGPDLQRRHFDAFVAKVNASGTAWSTAATSAAPAMTWARHCRGRVGQRLCDGRDRSTEATFPGQVGPDLTYNGGCDAFVAKVNAAGTGLVYCGYIGGSTV